MATKSLTDFKVLTFDCYGTMIDWESGIWDALQPLLMHNDCTTIDRQSALVLFAKHETEQERATPELLYPALLCKVHELMAAELNLASNESLNTQFGNSVPHWPAFPDSADALRLLKQHFKLVILSNVHRAGFAASNTKLGVTFDAIYTAEDVGSYKPNDKNFDYLLANLKADLGVEPQHVLHTAQSLHHDLVPATRAGLHKAWIDRQDLANGNAWGATAKVSERPSYDFHFPSLMEMAKNL